ncbi:class I SAM-dependent DNA methyltransferase [Rubellimicrobium arenae]|uniref:class I SAM-dependent DNA methyltransferase n=1 Tax=Rubellimicrobium arenae TaxID=2817372 RepID=UPI001B306B5D|nr:class I SAM-dependent methyltransferase [Rubellimicrobium arenae]
MSDTESAAMAAVYAARTVGELAAGYADWAERYDAETAASGYRLPHLCAAFLARHLPAEARPILDAGCGTGLVGDDLRALGYDGITGIDLSEPMLARAAGRGVYAVLRQMTLGEPLDLPDAGFAAVISSGVFTAGHAPASSLDELLRVTRPGGVLVFSVRDDIHRTQGFRERQDALEAQGRWRLRERSEPVRAFTVREPHVLARVFVYEAA